MSVSLNEQFVSILQTRDQMTGKADGLLHQLQERTVHVAQAEEQYTEITKLFGTFQSSIGEYTSIPGMDMEEITLATSVKDEAEATMNKLSHTLLTHFPYIAIPGNPPCVSPKKEPHVTGIPTAAAEFIKQCDAIRPIRGDGNCFFTAFSVILLENLVTDKSLDWFHHFIDAFPPKDKRLEALLKSISAEFVKLEPEGREALLTQNEKMFPLVNYLRQLAANHILNNKESFSPFFETSCEKYVESMVLPMGQNADHPAIMALCTVLNYPIRIFDSQLDSGKGVNIEGDKIKATLCRKDEHYFILYPNQGETRVTIHCEVPPGQSLFIRGEEGGLNWQKGIPLKPGSAPNTWIYTFSGDKPVAYKLLLDDSVWELGDNHAIAKGKQEKITPHFPESSLSTIRVKCKVPPGRTLFIRGEGGPGLKWDAGLRMTYMGEDVWEIGLKGITKSALYKVVLDDKEWESGDNHTIMGGKTAEHQPRF